MSRALTSRLPAGLILTLCLAIAALVMIVAVGPSAAHAQQGGVEISSLDCVSDPETVTILNSGTEPVDLSGWSLQSDPTASETFDLSPIQTLAGGASVTVEAGPAASGAFVWSQSEVLRDDDYTDFARVVDADVATVSEEACATAPSPAATPADIPNGGGPPGLTPGGPATALMFAGASLSTIAVAMVTLAIVPAGQVLSQIRARFSGSTRSNRDDSAAAPAVANPSVSATSIALIAGAAVVVMLLITFALRDRSNR